MFQNIFIFYFIENIIKNCQKESIPYYTICLALFKELSRQDYQAVQRHKEYEAIKNGKII